MIKKAYILFVFFAQLCFAQESALKELLSEATKVYHAGNPDSSVQIANKLYNEAVEQKSAKYKVKALYHIATVYIDENKIQDAFNIYYKALKVANEEGQPADAASVLNGLGAMYFSQKNYPESKQFFRQELATRYKIGDQGKIATALINISALYRKLNEYDSAAYYLSQAKNIVYKSNDRILYAHYFNAQSVYYFACFNKDNRAVNYRDSAEKYANSALKIWLSQANKAEALKPLFNLGYIYQTRRQYTKALDNYLLAKSIADSLKLDNSKITIYGNLAELYYDMSEYKKSAEYFRRWIETKDSVQKDEIKQYSVRLERQYRLDEKNKTILQQELEISRKNERINEQQKQLYLYIMLFVVLVFIVLAIIAYMNFNKRVAKKIEEAKQKFFTNVVHEIKTPLSMIQAPLKTLKPKVTDEEGIYYINLAERNINRLNELINQMLDISKLENVNYKLNNTVGNLDLFFKDLLVTYEKLATEKNIRFISEVNHPNHLLVFDKDALDKIFGNLLSNAIKYTPNNGNVGIMITCEEGDQRSLLHAEVWDTGIGIAPSEQDKVFSRFFRSERSATKIAGVGIGLSLVKDLVSAYNGTISFVSEENKGTKFVVEINLQHPEHAKPVEVEQTESKPLVLLIEDDEDISGFVSSFLKSKQYNVVRAANGFIAQTMLKNLVPDLIITDLMMEQMDGLTFIKEIKSNKGLNHIPVIVLSAKSSQQSRVEVLNAGAQSFLAKPFLPDELYSVVSNQLELIAKVRHETKANIDTPKPQQTVEQKFSSTEPYTQKLFELIFKNLDNSDLSVELLADLMATNRSHFQRKIKNLTGYSPSEIIKLIRLEKAMEFLLAKKGNITEVAYMCGFSSQSYFTKCFTQHFGYSPTQAIEKAGM